MKRWILAVLVIGCLVGWGATGVAFEGKLDINTASVSELMTLKGIGQTYAERIVAYRTEHGPFSTVSELVQVKGIGNKILDKLESQIRVGKEKPEAPKVE